MTDTIIVSGGDIHSDFALDFLKKKHRSGRKKKYKTDRSRQRSGIFYKSGNPSGYSSGRF